MFLQGRNIQNHLHNTADDVYEKTKGYTLAFGKNKACIDCSIKLLTHVLRTNTCLIVIYIKANGRAKRGPFDCRIHLIFTMTTKKASDVGSMAGTKRAKTRYQQFVEAATPSVTIKQDDVPLMAAMRHVRESIPDFSALEPLLQTIILESAGEYLCTASSYYFKVLAHKRMTEDHDFIPHSVRYKCELSAPATIRGSQGFKAASATADAILKEASLKLKDVLIDVSKLAINELREQLIKTIVSHLPGLGGGLSIHRGKESYAKHRIFADLMTGHGDVIVQNILPGRHTKVALVASYLNKHQITALAPVSIVQTIVTNPYATNVQLSGTRRDRTNFQSELQTQRDRCEDGLDMEDMSFGTSTSDDDITQQPPVVQIGPTRIDDDIGWLTPHRAALLAELNTWIHVIYGKSWTKYLEEEENIQKQKQLRKLRDESLKSALADDTQAILDRDGTLDRQSLEALITKRTQEELRRALAKIKVGGKTNSKGDKNSEKGSNKKKNCGAMTAPPGKRNQSLRKKLQRRREKEKRAAAKEEKAKIPPTRQKEKVAVDLQTSRPRKAKGHPRAKEGQTKSKLGNY